MTLGDKIIPLNRPQRLLQKTEAYLADMDLFLVDGEKAVTILLDTLPHADRALIMKMLPLLGYVGRDSVLWPLYSLMTKAHMDEPLRRSVALQLALALSLSSDASQLQNRLIADLSHTDPSIRSSCALALGWEGNLPAADVLMRHLMDPDREVQAAVVSALSSVGDVRVLNTLIRRLKTGTSEEQRSILLNLWRFEEQIPRVETVYMDCLAGGSPDVRLDALCALAMLPLSTVILDAYRRLLIDNDPRIRCQVIENLSVASPLDYRCLIDNLRDLLTDKDAKVRQAAVSLFARR